MQNECSQKRLRKSFGKKRSKWWWVDNVALIQLHYHLFQPCITAQRRTTLCWLYTCHWTSRSSWHPKSHPYLPFLMALLPGSHIRLLDRGRGGDLRHKCIHLCWEFAQWCHYMVGAIVVARACMGTDKGTWPLYLLGAIQVGSLGGTWVVYLAGEGNLYDPGDKSGLNRCRISSKRWSLEASTAPVRNHRQFTLCFCPKVVCGLCK
jgi:hypothetical protein